MNIADLPSELYDCYIFNDLLPHCNLINGYFKFIDIVIVDSINSKYLCDDDTEIIIIDQLCFNNNKSLLMFYQYCSFLELNKLIYHLWCKYCIKYNCIRTFKWIVKHHICVDDGHRYCYRLSHNNNNKTLLYNCYSVYAIEYNRLSIFKLVVNDDYHEMYLDKHLLFHAIEHNRVSIIKWLIHKHSPIDIHTFDFKNRTCDNIKITKHMCNLLQKYIILKS